MMKWDEINRRLKNGTSVKILAELDGVDYKTMYNRIRQHERKDGKTYMQESQLRAKRKPLKEEKKPWFLESSCETCLHRKESQETKEKYCAMGHKYEGPAGVCSEWSDPDPGKTVELPEVKPDFLTKKLIIPEVVPDPTPKPERRLMPETIEEILTLYKQCCELADRYTKQAEDWARIMDVLQVEDRARISRKLPEGDGNG